MRKRAELAAMLLSWAALATAASPAVAQSALGRLFYTPEQREDLDRRRSSNARESLISTDGTLTVNGQVRRSSGLGTTWINGVPQDDRTRPRSRPADATQATVNLGDSEPPAKLKVGETLDRGRGEVSDPLEGGKITVNRAGKAAR